MPRQPGVLHPTGLVARWHATSAAGLPLKWLASLQVKPTASQSWDWQEKARRLVWKFKRVQGNSEHMLKVRFGCCESGLHACSVNGQQTTFAPMADCSLASMQSRLPR